MLDKRVLYVAGLPRAGSTLLCQLLSTHPMIHSPGHSSPLFDTLMGLRHTMSDNPFLLAQLDADFDAVYARLYRSFRGFMNGWLSDAPEPWVVDKNRGWLGQLELVEALDPDFRMVICVREPGQILGSIESQHQRTVLLDFPDHLAALPRAERAKSLMDAKGVVGGPLHTIQGLVHERESLQRRLYYLVFEQLMLEPEATLDGLYQWLGLPSETIDRNDLPIRPHESDSYYRFKYTHATRPTISPPARHTVPPLLEGELQSTFAWFYRLFYPGRVSSPQEPSDLAR